jgi:hypothetical protein
MVDATKPVFFVPSEEKRGPPMWTCIGNDAYISICRPEGYEVLAKKADA